jgi:hypothetical protein
MSLVPFILPLYLIYLSAAAVAAMQMRVTIIYFSKPILVLLVACTRSHRYENSRVGASLVRSQVM